MHLVGLETMASSSSLLLKGEVSLEQELIGQITISTKQIIKLNKKTTLMYAWVDNLSVPS